MITSPYNFCLITGENYISKALALYHSLHRHCPSFGLYYFCFDEVTYETIGRLKKLDSKYDYITTIARSEFQNGTLDEIEKSRTQQEYYWTLTPNIIKYAIEQFNLQNLTYLDADLYFFQDPGLLLNELPNGKNVIITPHNYSDDFKHLMYAGEFCVQFNTFTNAPDSLNVLYDWQRKCNDWCYLRHEDGKFADQGYLTEWPGRFENVHILQNEGGGMAPWNIKKFKPCSVNGTLKNKSSGQVYSLNFYHFQAVKLYFGLLFYTGGYKLPKWTQSRLYQPYFSELAQTTKMLKRLNKRLNPMGNKNGLGNLSFVLKNLIKQNLTLKP